MSEQLQKNIMNRVYAVHTLKRMRDRVIFGTALVVAFLVMWPYVSFYQVLVNFSGLELSLVFNFIVSAVENTETTVRISSAVIVFLGLIYLSRIVKSLSENNSNILVERRVSF